MAMSLRELRDWRGHTSRRDYFLWGFGLFALKYNLDRLVSAKVFDQAWLPWNYLFGATGRADSSSGSAPAPLALTLLGMSLPFIWAGVILTVRRLRDAGWPAGLVALFFVPFVNLIFFAVLCLQTSRPPGPAGLPPPARSWLHSENPLFAAALGVLSSALIAVVLTAFGAIFLQAYGWGLFVGIPFMMGLTSTLVFAAARPRAWWECFLVSLAATGLAGALVLVLAIEGFICILMALPIAGCLALFGGGVGYWIQIERWSHRLDHVRLHAAWLAVPALMIAEAHAPSSSTEHAVTTVCEVAAPPAVVWRHVVAFSDLPPPTETIFLAGIAYPVRARLEGEGVGAVRHCEFSTGPFVEPITAWEEGRHLAFDVVAQPHPMREWSPYSRLEPAHLEGFFRSRRGEFRLQPLDGGRRTRLAGTTWYEQDIWPGPYWRLWSDYLVHSIHQRVLDHIRAEAEKSAANFPISPP